MNLRPATKADHPAIEAFLRRHEPSSIFPLSNLVGSRNGTDSGQHMWIRADSGPESGADSGAVQGVVALTDSGFLMPQMPGVPAVAVMQAVTGQRIAALIGPADQVAALMVQIIAPVRRHSREPLCTLDLADLILPDPQGCSLQPIRVQDQALAIEFRMAFDIEVIGQPPATARAKAKGDMARWLADDSHRLLWLGGQPVALTGLNAKLPDVVQVGGVYVPPVFRNQGLARRAVAAHLAEARAQGAQRAVLFAASDAALRSYQAIGFEQKGWMSMVLLHKAITL